MKTIQVKKSRYFMFLVLLLLGFARLPGYGQDLHTPYPIIFVHGLGANDETWDVISNYLQTQCGYTFGGRMDFCLNQDANLYSSILPDDYKDYTNIDDLHRIHKGDFYTVNFDVDNFGTPHDIDIESNQSAIVKQGWAIRDAVKHVINITGCDKVILVGHSMGGLASREYLQNKNLWYESSNHHVAKLCTIGTPHGGSNSTDFGTGISGQDMSSEAVRDLRRSYWISGNSGVYLLGGVENYFYLLDNPYTVPFYNIDVNCNGKSEESITGLNNKWYPTDLAFSCIIGVGDKLGADDNPAETGDGVVSEYRANINYFFPKVNADVFVLHKNSGLLSVWHSELPKQIEGIMQALDEPESEDFVYEIGEKSTNKGFITYQTDNIGTDIDLYKLVLSKEGLLKITLQGNASTGIKSIDLLDSNLKTIRRIDGINATIDDVLNGRVDPITDQVGTGTGTIEESLNAGIYYVRVTGIASGTTYQYPYTLKTQFTATPPAALAVSPGSLQFYDVVIGTPKEKTVTLTNNGSVNILITSIGLTGADADQFTVAPMLPFEVTSELQQNLTVTFNPTSTGAKVASIEITTNSPDIPTKTISLKGNAVDHETMVLVSNPADTYNYGNTKVSTSKNKTFTLQNTGSNTCTISGLALEGLNPDEYSITAPSVIPFDLGSGATKQITVKFSPTSIGVKNAALAISNNSDVPKLSIDLYGNGTENYYSGSNNTILAYEYWFDDQYGSRVNTPVIQDRESWLNAQVSTEGLQTGLHSFHLRYKDQKGKWSSIVSEFFHKLPVTAAGSRKIAASEYWFDDAFDTRVSAPVTPDPMISVNSSLDVGSLSNGLHSYHVRYKDDAGQWSSVVSEFFHKLPVTATGSRKITASEYWFDDAFASKVSAPVTPGQTITVNSGLDVASLPNGLHSYHVRYKDDAGQWSSVVSEFFHKLPISVSGTNLITTYRYWFDRNETAIQTVILPTPVNPYQLVRDINTCSLTDGDHTIHFQFSDSNHAWSSVATDTITKSASLAPEITVNGSKTICQGNTVTLTASSADSYLWNTGATTQDIVVSASGNYSVTVNKDSNCEKTSEVTAIVVNPLPNTAGVISGNGNVAKNQSNLIYSVPAIDGAGSYIWTLPTGATGTSTTNSITVSYGNDAVSGDIKVKGHNDCGDGTESSLVITVNSILTQDIALNTGWNIISADIVPSNPEMKTIFQPLIDAGSLKKVMDEAGKTIENFGAFGGWKNNIGNLNTTKGYKVNVLSPATLSLEGTAVQLPLDINLATGWNIISYPATSAQDAKALFQSLIDAGKLKKVMDEAGKTIENFGAFGGWKNNIGNFIAGKGYKVNVLENSTLTIPANGTKSAVVLPELIASEHFKPVFIGNGTDHTNINLVDLQASGLEVDDEIGVFDGNLCVGSATVGIENLMAQCISIPASCEDGMNKTMDGFTPGHPISLKLFRNAKEYNLKPETVLNSQKVFTKGESMFAKVSFERTTGFVELANQTELKCYPNPFSDQIIVEIELQRPQKLEVKIYDANGKLVRNLYKGKAEIRTLLVWDGKNDGGSKMVPGNYLIRANNQIKKLIMN